MTLTGPDASWHQGTINWQSVRNAGMDFAIIKATEGTSYTHTDWFETNWPRVHASGLVPGAYHFLRANQSPAQQADYFVNTVGDFNGVLACLDVETGADGGHPTSQNAHDFALRFNQRVPNHPLIVYTGRWYWVGVLGNPLDGATIGPLWHSAYTATPGSTYGGWPKFTFWQYTSSGTCPGIPSPCDLNQFFGTNSDLLALTGGEEDMPLDDNDKKWLSAEMYKQANASNVRAVSFSLTGAQNSVFSSAVDGMDWVLTAIDNAELLKKITASNDAQTKAILDAIAALPTGPGGSLAYDDVVTAVKQAGREGCG